MAAKKRVRTVECCIACHSPHLERKLEDGKPRYLCMRCGYSAATCERKSIGELQKLLEQRRVSVHRLHHLRAERKRSHFHDHLGRFRLRAWLQLIGVFFLVFGFLLLLSPEWSTGIVFLAVGAVSMYNGRKF